METWEFEEIMKLAATFFYRNAPPSHRALNTGVYSFEKNFPRDQHDRRMEALATLDRSFFQTFTDEILSDDYRRELMMTEQFDNRR
jgi:hypothetical protein